MDVARGFLDFFWALGSSQPEIRAEAASGLVDFLIQQQASAKPASVASTNQESNKDSTDREKAKGRHGDHGQSFKNLISLSGTSACEDLQYAANRLLAGLTSPRACVRQGYSVALLLLLLLFKKEIPREKVLTALEQHTSTAKVLPSEVKDLLLGRLFGYAVLQKTGYFRSNACLTQCQTVFSSLWKIIDEKVYLQEAACRLMRLIIVDLSTFSPSIALQFVHSRLEALAAVRVGAAASADGDAASDGEEKKQLGKTVTGRLPCSLAALLLDLRWAASHWGWTAKRESFTHLDILFNLDLLHEKERPRLMAFLVDTAAFHPRLHSLWDACLKLLLHCRMDEPKAAFLKWWRSVQRALFPEFPSSASRPADAASGRDAKKTEENTTESQSLQKEFLGFRLVIEVFLRLKQCALVGGEDLCMEETEKKRKGEREESKKQMSQKEALQVVAEFWPHSDGFLRALVRHLEASRGDPLRPMAEMVLDSLAVIFTGKSLSAPLSLGAAAEASSASRTGAGRLVSPFASFSSCGKAAEARKAKNLHLECGCLRDPTDEGLFASLLADDSGAFHARRATWVQQQVSASVGDEAKEKAKRKSRSDDSTGHPASPALGGDLDVLRHPFPLSLASRFEVLRAWGEAVRFRPLKKGLMKKLCRLALGGGLTVGDLRGDVFASRLFEVCRGPSASAGDANKATGTETAGASWRRLLWLVDFLLLLPQQFSSGASELSAALSFFFSVLLSLLLSSSFQLSASTPLPPVLFASPAAIFSAAKALSPSSAPEALDEASLSSFAFLLVAPPRSTLPVLLPKLMSVHSFLLSRHMDSLVKSQSDAATVSAGAQGGHRFVEALHSTHAVCYAAAAAARDEASAAVSFAATASEKAARKGAWKKEGGVDASGFTVDLALAPAMAKGVTQGEVAALEAQVGASGVDSDEYAAAAEEARHISRRKRGRDESGNASDALLLSSCFEASRHARALESAAASLDQEEELQQHEKPANEIILRKGLATACRAVAAGVASLALYPYFAFGSRRSRRSEGRRKRDDDEQGDNGRKRPRCEGNTASEEDGEMDSPPASDSESDAEAEASPLEGSLFGSQAAAYEDAQGEAAREEEEREELSDFFTLMSELSSQAEALVSLLRSATPARKTKKREDGAAAAGSAGAAATETTLFAQLAAILAGTAKSASHLMFHDGDSPSVGYLRASGRALWKAICPFAAFTEIESLLDVVLDRQEEAAEEKGCCAEEAEKPEAADEDEAEGEAEGEESAEDAEEEDEEDAEEAEKDEESEEESEEDSGDEEAKADDNREEKTEEEDDDDKFSIELDADATYRALLDENGDALPGAYVPPHTEFRRQALLERKRRENERLRQLQLRLRALEVLQVYLEVNPRSSHSLSLLAALFGGFDRIALRSALSRQKKNAKTSATGGLHQHLAEKIQKVILDACVASRHRRRPTPAAAKSCDGAQAGSASDRACVLLEQGDRNATAVAAALLSWREAAWEGGDSHSGQGAKAAAASLGSMPPVVLLRGWNKPGQSRESLANCVTCEIVEDDGRARDLRASNTKLSATEKSLRKAWEAVETCIGLRALEVLETCIACRHLPQAQAAASCQYVGLNLLVFLFKVEQQAGEFFSQAIAGKSHGGAGGATWGGSVASQTLNLALNDWLTKRSSRQQQLDSAFFRFFAERRPEWMRFIDLLGAAQQRARGAFVRRECIAIGTAVARHPFFLSGRSADEAGKTRDRKQCRAEESDDEYPRDVGAKARESQSAGVHLRPCVTLDWDAWVLRGKKLRERRRGRPNKEAEGETEDTAAQLSPPLPVRQEVNETTFVALLEQLSASAEVAAAEASRGTFSSAGQMKASHREMLTSLKTILQASVTQLKSKGLLGGSLPVKQEDQAAQSVRSALEEEWTRVGERLLEAASKLQGQAGRHQGLYESIVRLVKILQGKKEEAPGSKARSVEAKREKRNEKRKRRDKR
ncbi:hypothetical protein BESB_067210 [Besnoitia besnoiti]|uniref:DNA polymerase phi subunit n=1 Tax=Besnoitia besnoiti TaxID=94643 RepID=A0A2A9M880_BESBE|nr:hypothetical protein BESB_067210 [Besnoitia besnoiti]PFH34688.1 hypothetical protein BESB_067210 [Besnoitia besnoiti]